MGSGIMPLVEKTVLQCEVARLIGEWRKLDNILYTSQHCFKTLVKEQLLHETGKTVASMLHKRSRKISSSFLLQ